jgi:chemotaxis response regulator CheB
MNNPTFIVGIGGSAGGLKAYTTLLNALPSDTGMAFVFIAHISPTVKSLLANLLSKSTRMPVFQAADQMRILKNHVYVIPPNTDLFIENSAENFAFKTASPRTMTQGRHHQVDTFLISLGQAMGAHAIAIILSGGDGDGAEGCKFIKSTGGKTFAQDLSADVESMPLHAEASGCVDFVLPPDQIAAELIKIGARL